MTCMYEENTIRANEEHLGDLKLTSKIGGSSVSRKTKNVIADANVNSGKITHQKHNGMNQLTKKEKNENSNSGKEEVVSVSRCDKKNHFTAALIGIFF